MILFVLVILHVLFPCVINAWNPSLNPCSVHLEHVSHKYSESFLRSLFSSVPKRDYSVQDISIQFQQEFSLLVGRSASGKSTLLNLIEGTIPPTEGNVHILTNESVQPSKAIIVDSKPDCFDNKSTVYNRIKDVAQGKGSMIDDLVKFYARTLTLSEEQLYNTPSQLSPSGQYLFGIACACIESSYIMEWNQEEDEVLVSAPILLLDELLDSETSKVASVVGNALQNLAKEGGLVLMATHRPEYVTTYSNRVITMSSGRILTII